jgi:hypothetical protein
VKIAKGPRPWTIHAFAAIVIAIGLWNLIEVLLEPDFHTHAMQRRLPQIAWIEDFTIVFASARFTIVCIPVLAIWMFASRIARWLVTIMIGYRFLMELRSFFDILPSGGLDGWLYYNWPSPLSTILLTVGASLLFIPQSNLWFRSKRVEQHREADVAAFE